MRIREFASATDKGLVRAHNEDALLLVPEAALFAVADGMGGHAAGDVASALAVKALSEASSEIFTRISAAEADPDSARRVALATALEDAMQRAHEQVAAEAKRRGERRGMGSTLVAVAFAGPRATVAHVGDSRAYLLRSGRLRRLTRDHTVATMREQLGRLTAEQAARSPDAHMLTQAIGMGGDPDPDVCEVALAEDDVLLLCSDGLHGVVSEARIQATLDRPDLVAAAKALVAAAHDAGAPDNVSVVAVRVGVERDRATVDEIARVLASVPVLRALDDAERHLLAPWMNEYSFATGEVIAREGDAADELFAMVQGGARITRGGLHLVDVRPGGHFGELALARPTRRSATVTATEPTLVYGLSRARFQQVVRRRPALGAKLSLALLDAVGDRLRDVTERLAAVESAVRGDLRLPDAG